jgi:hypothetical protein
MFAVEIIVDKSLYAVRFDGNATDEFRKLFEQWSDIEFLYEFFESNINDLSRDFYGFITIEEAIQLTLKFGEILRKKLLRLANNVKSSDNEDLSCLFKPLNNDQIYRYPPQILERSKAFGIESKSWLRIYALRIDKNEFLVTGGAIKLTATMNERQHTLNELQKLNMVRNFLINQGYIDGENPADFLELE